MTEYLDSVYTEIQSHDNCLLVMGRGMGLNLVINRVVSNLVSQPVLALILNLPGGVCPPGAVSIAAETPPSARQSLYLKGGVFAVTNRVITVDLLNKIVPLVDSIIVYNAHQILPESSSLAFILRMLKAHKVHSFSSVPEAFSSSVSKLEKSLRALQTRNIFLYPRFRQIVQQCISARPVDVVELAQPLSPDMLEIQSNLMDLLDGCVSQVKKAHPNELEIELISTGASNVEFSLRRQLDSVWHELGPGTKATISDIALIRRLIRFLYMYDSISFHEYLLAVRAAGGSPDSNSSSSSAKKLFPTARSPWLYVDSAQTVFRLAKERVYSVIEGSLNVKLEPNPKWYLLHEILEEIVEESADLEDTKVLIVCETKSRAKELQDVVLSSPDTYMKKKWLSFLKRMKLQEPKASNELKNSRRRTEVILLRNEMETLHREFQKRPSHGPIDDFVGKKQKTSSASVVPLVLSTETIDESSSDYLELRLANGVTIVISSFWQEADVLSEVKPHFVIMFDPSVEIVRQVEVFRASTPSHPLRLYFTVFENSTEEKLYMNKLEKESIAFESLIRNKSVIIVPSGDLEVDLSRNVRMNELLSSGDSSRKGGSSTTKSTTKVVVDLREFRSDLPSFIHGRGMEVSPVTLEVGDYILSPNIVVERKSIADLIGSLASGRLYSQLKAMVSSYPTPALLIEFDSDKRFSLQSQASVKDSGDFSKKSIQSKLVVVALHFPKVRFIWSRSPFHSAEMFEHLKEHEPEPSVDQAYYAGLNGGFDSSGVDETTNEILSILPGVRLHSLRAAKISNLAELFNSEQSRLDQVLGSKNSANLCRLVEYDMGI